MHFYYKLDKKPYSCQAQERNLLEKVQGRTAKRLERLTFFLCTAKDLEKDAATRDVKLIKTNFDFNF